MPKMQIERSIVIDAPVDKVYNILNDFNQWIVWSPWLIMSPQAKVTVSEDAKSYEWDGERVGSGSMRILSEDVNKSIDYDLVFLKPWKSQANVRFILEHEEDTTKVTWTMDSGLPFFMFFMKKMMEAFVGADYERGLDMLKAYAENDEVPSKLDWKGTSSFNGCKYVGIHTQCSLDDVGERMKNDFGKIWEFAGKDEENLDGDALTIYHKWDLVKNKISYTSAVPVKEVPADIPSGFTKGEIPATEVYTLEHTGRYQHLGNAWSTLYAMNRAKEFKTKKGIHPFERYLNNPEDTPEKELITQVHFAVK